MNLPVSVVALIVVAVVGVIFVGSIWLMRKYGNFGKGKNRTMQFK